MLPLLRCAASRDLAVPLLISLAVWQPVLVALTLLLKRPVEAMGHRLVYPHALVTIGVIFLLVDIIRCACECRCPRRGSVRRGGVRPRARAVRSRRASPRVQFGDHTELFFVRDGRLPRHSGARECVLLWVGSDGGVGRRGGGCVCCCILDCDVVWCALVREYVCVTALRCRRRALQSSAAEFYC